MTIMSKLLNEKKKNILLKFQILPTQTTTRSNRLLMSIFNFNDYTRSD